MTNPKTPNRLAQEKSPYLLQHAHNPIDWYPWGNEAFERAKREDKPIFLSIGYSTCHWCHVMEKESFEDEEIAAQLKENFIAIKVDREERPDIDHLYMSVCQAMTGQGGWPLTILMTPEKEPFFTGTYFPKSAKWGRPGLTEVLTVINREWLQNRDQVKATGAKLVSYLREQNAKPQAGGANNLTEDVLQKTFAQLSRDFDPAYGGFSPAPKFPTPHNLLFLLRYFQKTGGQKAAAMVEHTLSSMIRGGIYDHLGYGFARYSTDEQWLAPHFEKMLYDNALLCYALTEAYQVTGNSDFARVAQEIITYVLRDMSGPEGEFYSAEDADSEGREGKFYVWTHQEIIDLLGAETGGLFNKVYGIIKEGNFEHGQNIPNLIEQDLKEYARKNNLNFPKLNEEMAEARQKLYLAREKRVHPFKDDKVLTAWNALMIAALSKAGRVLGRSDFILAARRAADFLDQKLFRQDGRLLARYRGGEAAHLAYLDDYAFLLWGLWELYESTFEPAFLEKALRLMAGLKKFFWDEKAGGFFFTAADGEELIVRRKELYDGALPSGNSVLALVLLKFSRLLCIDEYREMAEAMFACFGAEVASQPRAYAFFMTALDYYFSPPREVVIAGDETDEETQAMLRCAQEAFLPSAVFFFNRASRREKNAALLPHLVGQTAINGKATAYVCENFACRQPLQSAEELKRLLLRN